jgi:16S rRNA (uracil1498-N3)-methyltransferase
MQVFYHPNIENELITVTPEESRHISVLRIKPGDSLYITNGLGLMCKAIVADSSSKAVQLQIMERYDNYGKQSYFLHIAIAPTKQMERLEWFLEKATEIGIHEITPVICHQSERKDLKTERLIKILQSAMKQSLKAFLPRLNEPVSFEHFIKMSSGGNKFIANAAAGENNHLKNFINKNEKSLVLIGPEGDFTEKEMETAISNAYRAVSLGQSRLRTETAGLLACATVALANS